MKTYYCSVCGAKAFYDGRCGDGPVLVCGCDRKRSRWVNDRGGGYWTNPTGARPVSDNEGDDTDGDWNRGNDHH
jgi:hypothetical protein